MAPDVSEPGVDGQPPENDSDTESSNRYFSDQNGQAQENGTEESDTSAEASRTGEPRNGEGQTDVANEETREHLTELTRFAKEMETAALRMEKEKTHFTRVVVVCCYWERARNLGHMKANAQKLGNLFRSRFGFEVLDYEIPRNTTELMFAIKVGQEVDKIRTVRDSLFIFYYGGHGTKVDEAGNFCRMFKAENARGSPEIDWKSASRIIFNKSLCQNLLLLDCCHAGAMAELDGGNLDCELLGACSSDSLAGALKDKSFTEALIGELNSSEPSALDLASILSSTWKKREYHLDMDPWYMNYTQLPSAALRLRQQPSPEPSDPPPGDTGSNRASVPKSDGRVIIKVMFRGSAAGFLKNYSQIVQNWKRWFYYAPSGVHPFLLRAVQETQLVSLFDSNSCIAIFALPIWLWGCMSHDLSYQFLGVVRSHDYTVSGGSPSLPLGLSRRNSDPVIKFNSKALVSWQSDTRTMKLSALETSITPAADLQNEQIEIIKPQTQEEPALSKPPVPSPEEINPKPTRKNSPKFSLSRVTTNLPNQIRMLTPFVKSRPQKSPVPESKVKQPATQTTQAVAPGNNSSKKVSLASTTKPQPSPVGEVGRTSDKLPRPRFDGFDDDEMISYWPIPETEAGIPQLNALVPDKKIAAEIEKLHLGGRANSYFQEVWNAPWSHIPTSIAIK